MASQTNYGGIAALGAVAIIGYGLLRSDFFKNLGGVSGGVSDAFEGVGGGIGQVGSSVGQTAENIADFINPLGSLGNSVSRNIERESNQKEFIDNQAFEQNNADLSNLQAQTELELANQSSLRKTIVSQTATNVTQNVADFVNSGPQSIVTYTPLGLITNFVKSQVSSLRSTGNAVSQSSQPSQQSSQSSQGTSVRNSSSAGSFTPAPQGAPVSVNAPMSVASDPNTSQGTSVRSPSIVSKVTSSVSSFFGRFF